jgi:hypothetical protein
VRADGWIPVTSTGMTGAVVMIAVAWRSQAL